MLGSKGKMIVLDIETTGLDYWKHGIVSIGALCFENPKQQFYEECRIDDEDEITKEALEINGFSEKEVKDKKKQSQKQLIERFYSWADKQPERILAGHKVGFFDMNFLKAKAEKYGIKIKTRFRSFDLCTLAQTVYFQKNGKFLLDDLGENAMNLSKVLEFCGIPDERILFHEHEKVKDGKSHNALEDCKLEVECFSRLLKGEYIFPEYKQFPVPEYLKQNLKQ